MEFSIEQVKQLREKTGAGVMLCKQALAESSGDVDKAVEYLQKKGQASAAKKAGRATGEGAVGSYIHMGGKIGVLVEVNCETDFVAKTDAFQEFARDVAMHIAAMGPAYLVPDQIPEGDLAHQREIFLARTLEEGKPEKIAGKIVDGRMSKWFAEVCLMQQSFVKDSDKTIEQLQAAMVAKTGENIRIRRFVRFALGE